MSRNEILAQIEELHKQADHSAVVQAVTGIDGML